MNKIINKVGASVFAMVFAVSAIANPVSASTIEELQALITQLTAQIAALSSGSTTTTTTTTTGYVHTGVEKDFTFNILTVGSRGEEVKALQKVINTGADGNFGPNTKAALIAWQKANGLVADGIAGAATRAEFNKKTTVTVPTTVSTTVPTTVSTDEEENNLSVDGDKLVVFGTMTDDMVVGNSQKVVFSKLTFTAGDEDVEVKDINVEFTGTAGYEVIDKVLLLDATSLELDSGTFNSDEEAKLDADIEVEEGETVTVYIGALMAENLGVYGLEASVKVTSITTDGADVEGDSVKGAVHEIQAGVSVDQFSAEITMEESEVRIGEESLKIATVNVENKSTSDDPEFVKSIKLTRIKHDTGSLAGDNALENVEIEVNGETYKATQDEEDYLFNFGNGIELAEKSDDEDFEVRVDVVDDAGDVFAFMIKDIVVVDEDGIFLTDDGAYMDNKYTNYTDSTDVATIAVSQVDIDFNTDVSSKKVSAGENSVDFTSFDVEVTGSDVEGDLKARFFLTGVNISDDLITEDFDLDNVAIYKKDGDRVSDREDTSFEIVRAAETEEFGIDTVQYIVTFDDVKFEHSNEEVDFVIRGDINKDAVDGAIYKVFDIEYISVEDESGDDVSVDLAEVTSPVAIEVEGALISVSIENPDDTKVNPDTDNVEIAEIKLDASNSGDDINVTKIELAFSTTATSTSADIGDLLKRCELFDGSGSVSDSETASASVTYNTAEDITVARDSEKTLFVRCDIGSEFLEDETITVAGISFDAEGANTGTDLDADFDESTTVTITHGTAELKLLLSGESNDDKLVKDDADNVVLGTYEFKAKNAELEIDTITAKFNTNVSGIIEGKVDLYINDDEETDVLEESENPSENPTDVAKSLVSFTSVDRTVGKDDTVTIKIKGDVELAHAGIQITSLEVTTKEGVNPGAVTGTAGADQSTSAPLVMVKDALPVITQINVSKDLPTSNETDKKLLGFSVKYEGDSNELSRVGFSVSTTGDITFVDNKIRVESYDNSEGDGSPEMEETYIIPAADADKSSFDVMIASNSASILDLSENEEYFIFVIADIKVETGYTDGGTIITTIPKEPQKVTFDENNADTIDAVYLMEDKMESRIDW